MHPKYLSCEFNKNWHVLSNAIIFLLHKGSIKNANCVFLTNFFSLILFFFLHPNPNFVFNTTFHVDFEKIKLSFASNGYSKSRLSKKNIHRRGEMFAPTVLQFSSMSPKNFFLTCGSDQDGQKNASFGFGYLEASSDPENFMPETSSIIRNFPKVRIEKYSQECETGASQSQRIFSQEKYCDFSISMLQKMRKYTLTLTRSRFALRKYFSILTLENFLICSFSLCRYYFTIGHIPTLTHTHTHTHTKPPSKAARENCDKLH